MDNKEKIDVLKAVLIIVVIIAVGAFALNQFFTWLFHMQLMQEPCHLCMQYNNVSCEPKLGFNNLTGEFSLPKPWGIKLY